MTVLLSPPERAADRWSGECGTPLAHRLERALADGDQQRLAAVAEAEPADERDLLLTLLTIHDLHLGPIGPLAGTERFQHHPAVAALKWRLEDRLAEQLDGRAAPLLAALPASTDAVGALRRIAAIDLTPPVYGWLAERASAAELRSFLALEGGPDGGFDDLVAACQVGLSGAPKLELARNYWDEMGNGDGAAVHTELHHDLARSLALPRVDRRLQPTAGLLRAAVGGLLATNRHLQPEMVGALGLIELQAGPRCRKVLQGLRRTGAPTGAFPFYEVHAEVDPRHGKDWLDHAVAPLQAEPRWRQGMVRGAAWRSAANAAFFAAMADRFC